MRVDVDGAVGALAVEVVGELPIRMGSVGGMDIGASVIDALGVWADPPWQNAWGITTCGGSGT